MLAPLRIVWRDPVALNSADSLGACRCDDGAEYVLKDGRQHPLTPHAEWFCTHVAQAVGIACPPCAIVEDSKGDLFFGSRIEGGLARDNWWEMVARGEIDLAVIAPVLSRVFAFDCFVYNDDRHLNNFLTRESRNQWTLLTFDFSRAWTFHGFPPRPLPFAPTDNTLRAHRVLKNIVGDFLDIPAVDEVMHRLEQVAVSTVKNIVQSHPKQWLATSEANTLLAWWQSTGRTDRINSIRRGIADGTYL